MSTTIATMIATSSSNVSACVNASLGDMVELDSASVSTSVT